MSSNAFVEDVMATAIARNPGEVEFHQAVREVVESVAVVVAKNKSFSKG